MSYGSTLRQRGGPLPRCTALLRRAIHGLQRAARFRLTERKRATALALCWEEAQHARLRRARAPLRWSESAHVLWKPTARARRPFSSVHGLAPTCHLRPAMSSRRSRVRTREYATRRALSREEAQHARFRRARAPPRLLESAHVLWKHTAPARRPLPRYTALLRRAIHGLQRLAVIRVCAHANTPLGVLSLGRRQWGWKGSSS